MVGGGSGGCAMAAKLSSRLGKDKVIVLEPAEVRKLLKNMNTIMSTLSIHSAATLLPTHVHAYWRRHEASGAFVQTDGRCAAPEGKVAAG